MSTLSDLLSNYKTSRSVAKFCDTNSIPISAIFCRLQIDRPPIVPNMMYEWTIANPNITANDFAAMDTFFMAHPEIRDSIVSNLKLHAPQLWVDPLVNFTNVPRTELFSRTIFQGGILNTVKPLDETYALCSLSDLQLVMSHYRDIYPWAVDNDCNKKANRITGFFASLVTPRPVAGEAEITGLKNGNPFGHFMNFAICTDGECWIENDGTIYPLSNVCGDLTNIVVQSGFY